MAAHQYNAANPELRLVGASGLRIERVDEREHRHRRSFARTDQFGWK
jgi:hypothetical protein